VLQRLKGFAAPSLSVPGVVVPGETDTDDHATSTDLWTRQRGKAGSPAQPNGR
jgi:hypothetical protein